MAFLPVADVAKNKKVTDEPKFGVVVDNNDPLMLGRVKVEIQGIFEGSADTLPWVRRKTDAIFCGADCEIFDVPEIGSVVEVRWSYDENTPVYSGAPYSKKHQTSSFTTNYPYEAGIKFGPHMIKFDKASKLMTIENSKVQVQLDALGGLSIAASDLDITVKRNVNLACQNVKIIGDVNIDGKLWTSHGANGIITGLTMAAVSGGIVGSCKSTI